MGNNTLIKMAHIGFRGDGEGLTVTTSVTVANQVDQDYLLSRLGAAADPNPRFFADPFAEAEMLDGGGRRYLVQEGRGP